jgi:hypothetical protein
MVHAVTTNNTIVKIKDDQIKGRKINVDRKKVDTKFNIIDATINKECSN